MHERQIVSHAERTPQEEACGLVVRPKEGKKLIAVECPNSADDPAHNFRIDPVHYADFLRAGTLAGIYHSHPGTDAEPSPADILAADILGLPFWIYATAAKEMRVYAPRAAKQPLLGRAFIPHFQDCYSLLQDACQLAGIALGHISRKTGAFIAGTHSRWFDWIAGNSGILVSTPKPGTIALIAMGGAAKPNHCGIYVGWNTLLHQRNDQASGHDTWAGSDWERFAMYLIDLPAMMAAGPQFQDGTLDFPASQV